MAQSSTDDSRTIVADVAAHSAPGTIVSDFHTTHILSYAMCTRQTWFQICWYTHQCNLLLLISTT